MKNKKLPGLNVQAPWAQLLLSGEKVIETRTYPLPQKYVNQWMWLIETPGKTQDFQARVIGMIKFSGSKQYKNATEWRAEYEWHLVKPDDPDYKWRRDKQKHGWVVEDVRTCRAFPAPKPRGIVYASPFERTTGTEL